MNSDVNMNYDVFISYRRDKGAMIARNLQQALSALGLKVFFDMEELTDGKFNEKLYDSIEQSKNVIFLMTEGALDRCVNEGDWVRNELEHVIDRDINLIPIAPTGTPIAFPDALPEKLAPLKVLEISELNLEKLFKESVAKIAGRLKGVVLASDKDKKEAEEAFLSQARRFKGNDGKIDAEEMRELVATAKELGIGNARRIKLIEQVEQEYVPAAAAGLDLMPPMPEVVPNFDVFISYRRDGGASDARLMYERLTKDGYTVSFDMDTLKSGNFNEELLRRIVGCKSVVVLLNKGCFDRTLKGCKREDDWLRIELATAIYNKKNIIAVMLPGFEFPAQLPPDIDEIRRKNGPKYDLYYIDSFYDKLEKDFLGKAETSAAVEGTTEEVNIISVDATVKERDSSLDDIFGDDSASWREEAELAYKSVSRVLPYQELKRLDDAWDAAEDNLNGGDHKVATKKYMEVVEIALKVKACSSPFVTRLVGDGIDTHAKGWFELTLEKAQSGDKDYQYGVGELYATGLGVEKDASAAFRWFERAAAQGHVQAIAAVGAAYSTGDGVEVDYKAAKKYLVKAEKKQVSRAIERLGYLYQNGYGVRRNYAVAVNKYKTAAKYGNSAAMVALGEMLESGIGVSADREKAIAWYRLAVANGSAVAQRKMAEFLLAGNGMERDDAEAVKLVRLAANQGDADAIAILGRAYENGTGVSADAAKAVDLYHKASDAGSALGKLYLTELEADAQYRNGIRCLVGDGVPQDFAVARSWFEKAAAQGHVCAMEELGFFDERGLGRDVDISSAMRWYEKASEQGNPVAMVGLGRIYFRGSDGVQKDYAKAEGYFKRAAAAWKTVDEENRWKVMHAFFYLGRIYTEGLGVEKDVMLGQRCHLFAAKNGNVASAHAIAVDYEKGTDGKVKSKDRAKEWYLKCVQLLKDGKVNFADDTALRVIGLLYQYGDGVEKDLEKSREWFMKSAALGNVQSLKSMGRAYLNGRGVPKNVGKGIELLEAAGNRGDADVQEDLGMLYYKGDKVEKDFGKAKLWFEKAVALGSGFAMEKLSRMYRDGDGVDCNEDESMRWLEKAAEKENPFAMAELGHCYECGARGKEIDVAKGVELYKKSADKKSMRGRYEYGRCLAKGIGVDANLDEAFKVLSKAILSGKDTWNYYQKVAQLFVEIYFSGDFDSNVERFSKEDEEVNGKVLVRMGWRLRAGDGVEKDVDKAVRCLTAAALRNDKMAQNSLGWMYYQGRVIGRDPKKAFEWTMKAVQNGNPHGMETLFRMYRDGDGVEKSETEAMKWLHRSADGEEFSAEAVAWLGECYESGAMGEAKDEKRAYQCYYKASQKRNTHAMYDRGMCYLNGIGVGKDADRALEWLSKAAEEDDDDLFYDERAMSKLIELYGCGDVIAKDDAKAQEWQKKLTELKTKRMEEIKGYVSPV